MVEWLLILMPIMIWCDEVFGSLLGNSSLDFAGVQVWILDIHNINVGQ